MKQFFTARKRSLGQGNVFTAVSHSVHGGRAGLYPGGGGSMHSGGWAYPQLDATVYGQRAGGTHPTVMHSFCFEFFEIRQNIFGRPQPTNQQANAQTS